MLSVLVRLVAKAVRNVFRVRELSVKEYDYVNVLVMRSSVVVGGPKAMLGQKYSQAKSQGFFGDTRFSGFWCCIRRLIRRLCCVVGEICDAASFGGPQGFRNVLVEIVANDPHLEGRLLVVSKPHQIAIIFSISKTAFS